VELKQVELVRRYVTGRVSDNVIRIRSWISCTDGNVDAVEQLRGDKGEALVADLVETILLHLGHATDVTRMQDGGAKLTSQARKSARGKLG
jgi:hypothetical protein